MVKSALEDTPMAALRRSLQGRPEVPAAHQNLSLSAVLLPLFTRKGEHHILLTKRTDLVEHHKGEICFPGGVQDPEDTDHRATALREAQEELGIEPRDVDILGFLDPVATGTGFLIWPVVGIIPYPYRFRIQRSEVAELLEVPISELLAPQTIREVRFVDQGRAGPSHSYVYQGHTVWGATARVLTQLLELLAPALKKEVPWSSP